MYVCARVSGFDSLELGNLESTMRRAPAADSISKLLLAAKANELPVEFIRTDMYSLCYWQRPAILCVNDDHFISFLGSEKGRFVLFDNAMGLYDCTPDFFNEKYRWRGFALVFGPLPPWCSALFTWPAVLPFAVFCAVLTFGIRRFFRRHPKSSLS